MAEELALVTPPLRRLPWPLPRAVDLALEFPWLLLHEDAASELQRAAAPRQDDKPPLDSHGSPYKQRLRAPREPAPSLSPAQRAARKMLRLQDELDRRDERARCLAEREARATSNAAVRTRASVSQAPVKKPKRTPLAGPLTPQAKLQQWLSQQTLEPATDASELFSREMASCIQSKMRATLGAGLWADEVASPLAAELSSESVFGGLAPTRRLKFEPATSPSQSPAKPPSEAAPVAPELMPLVAPSPARVEVFSHDVQHEARALAAVGAVDEALAALQRGVERVLYDVQDDQDELLARGFDFSPTAHAMASRVQRRYRARHRRRVASLVRLQRVWRRSHARRAFLAAHRYLATSATRIQRVYQHHARHRRAARIQRCFRAFRAQRLLVAWRRLGRLALARLAQRRATCRRVLAKLRALRCVALLLQTLWRAKAARAQLAAALSEAARFEKARGVREEAFVAPRARLVREPLRRFYRETRVGREVASAERRRAWLRWRRLRGAWHAVERGERAEAMRKIVGEREELRGAEARSAWAVLGGRAESVLRFGGTDLRWGEREEDEELIDVGKNVFQRWRTVLRTRFRCWRRRVGRVMWETLWTLVVYPKLVLESSFLFHKRRARDQTAAEQTLLDQHERLVRSLLRKMFRVLQDDSPTYECAWCNEGLATAKLFYAHRQGCAKQERRAEREQEQLAADLEHDRNRFFNKWKRWVWNRKSAPTKLTTLSPMMRVAKKCRDRAALRCLVDVAEACGTVLDNSVLVPREFLTQLLLLVDEDSGHPLERIHAATRTTQTWTRTHKPPEGWLALDDVRSTLGLASPIKPSRLRTLWTRLRSLWTTSWRHRPRDARVLAMA